MKAQKLMELKNTYQKTVTFGSPYLTVRLRCCVIPVSLRRFAYMMHVVVVTRLFSFVEQLYIPFLARPRQNPRLLPLALEPLVYHPGYAYHVIPIPVPR